MDGLQIYAGVTESGILPSVFNNPLGINSFSANENVAFLLTAS